MSEQVIAQIIGVVVTIGFTVIVSFIILKLIDMTIGLRVTEEQEIEGLDIALHEERGYII